MSKCFFCENSALVEMTILETKVFIKLCLEHLKNYVEKKGEEE